MQLLVLPDPNEGLADAVAGVVADVQRRHPAGHGLFPVGHGDDLFALERQEQQAPALELRPTGELGAPPVQQPLHVIEKGGLQILGPRRRQVGPCPQGGPHSR